MAVYGEENAKQTGRADGGLAGNEAWPGRSPEIGRPMGACCRRERRGDREEDVSFRPENEWCPSQGCK